LSAAQLRGPWEAAVGGSDFLETAAFVQIRSPFLLSSAWSLLCSSRWHVSLSAAVHGLPCLAPTD